MAEWDPITEPWQHLSADYLVGPGQPWAITRLAGWFDFELELNAQPYTYVPGSAVGVPHQTSPVISLGLELKTGTDGASTITAVSDLRDSWFGETETAWYTWFPGKGIVKATGFLIAGTLPEWTAVGQAPQLGQAAAQVQLYVPDPSSVVVVEARS